MTVSKKHVYQAIDQVPNAELRVKAVVKRILDTVAPALQQTQQHLAASALATATNATAAAAAAASSVPAVKPSSLFAWGRMTITIKDDAANTIELWKPKRADIIAVFAHIHMHRRALFSALAPDFEYVYEDASGDDRDFSAAQAVASQQEQAFAQQQAHCGMPNPDCPVTQAWFAAATAAAARSAEACSEALPRVELDAPESDFGAIQEALDRCWGVHKRTLCPALRRIGGVVAPVAQAPMPRPQPSAPMMVLRQQQQPQQQHQHQPTLEAPVDASLPVKSNPFRGLEFLASAASALLELELQQQPAQVRSLSPAVSVSSSSLSAPSSPVPAPLQTPSSPEMQLVADVYEPASYSYGSPQPSSESECEYPSSPKIRESKKQQRSIAPYSIAARPRLQKQQQQQQQQLQMQPQPQPQYYFHQFQPQTHAQPRQVVLFQPQQQQQQFVQESVVVSQQQYYMVAPSFQPQMIQVFPAHQQALMH
ncbi:hypothetical protein CAOG_05147 [Capsaspora owczarzaki ATCC 30864]|uniref:hypothetical protein n=1 Tax=Capsaspora owczarzaki (strain ATCC 30864) TaxID=595528 RepID=UPI0001FE2718|nr:hypothetical protein CAOG_05147 [Capsaspora owczarzaki ATCC 30864]|eukprot:XP_004346832.1 hypothetical protein CAOG_05147 [Capsaspora owczarzaki ATCC 30864]